MRFNTQIALFSRDELTKKNPARPHMKISPKKNQVNGKFISLPMALLHNSKSERDDPNPRRSYAMAATGTVVGRPSCVKRLSSATNMNGRCISQIELAQRWQISESTLERWRSEGIGPVFLKLRGQVRYRDIDILAYEDQALHVSTRHRSGAVASHTPDAQ
jgi:hypothetical protein